MKIAIQQHIQVDGPKKDGEATPAKVRKIVFPYAVINFSRQEEMIGFETEFKKAVEDLKQDLPK